MTKTFFILFIFSAGQVFSQKLDSTKLPTVTPSLETICVLTKKGHVTIRKEMKIDGIVVDKCKLQNIQDKTKQYDYLYKVKCTKDNSLYYVLMTNKQIDHAIDSKIKLKIQPCFWDNVNDEINCRKNIDLPIVTCVVQTKK